MLCLCPNHHDQFDALSFYIEPVNLEINGLDGFKGSKLFVQKRHKLESEFLEYHKQQFINKNPHLYD
jgi:predicted restriction endonuclease